MPRGEADKINATPVYDCRFILRSRDPIHTFVVSYFSELSDDRFSDMYCLKIHTFNFHTTIIIQAREMIAENYIEFFVNICP